jgi:predicted transcriptional regulator
VSVVDAQSTNLYKNGMAFTLTLNPEVEDQLRKVAQAEHRSVHKTVELAVEEYLARSKHEEELIAVYRRAVGRHGDFYRELGDR